ncbi:hypothetical protein Cylst_4373 [Cylindrospermum stagnale PCC 7417]|uniref:Uncharacterized protein n=1 Tax=Cylindrospermum stagnale PCC 7417 TaxID=56107 RepID=K9X1V7_9NOST|nr:hypothetical protein [Cylindrospermum stagnale]AFZ26463.1 hypothetical protein Cylst_4373 [Cylindrospermum stagnale PCC 7417]
MNMIVDRNLGVVADWWFEDRCRLAFPTSRSELQVLLKMCQSAAEVLEAHKLLKPSRVIFSGWLRAEPDENNLVRVEEPDITITILESTGSQELLTQCEKTLDQLEQQRSFLYPTDVKILGVGVVLDANGQEYELPDVSWLLGTTLDAHIVDVCTQSDAWLPYTLVAQPQIEVWKRNAPRLEAALQEIQARLNVKPYTNSCSDYALINGFSLENHTDADGEVLIVYGESV